MQVERISKGNYGRRKHRKPERVQAVSPEALEGIGKGDFQAPRKPWKASDGVQAKMTKLNDMHEFKRDAPPPTRRLYNPDRDPIIMIPKQNVTLDSINLKVKAAMPHTVLPSDSHTSTRRASIHAGAGRKLFDPYADEVQRNLQQSVNQDQVKRNPTHMRTKSAYEIKNNHLEHHIDVRKPLTKEERDAKSAKILLKEIALMEKQLHDLSNQVNTIEEVPRITAPSQNHNNEEYWQERTAFHFRLGQRYAEYLHLDYTAAAKQEIETRCWKFAFYTLIEEFRHALAVERLRSGNRDSSGLIVFAEFGKFLDKSESFFKNLLKQIAKDTMSLAQSKEKSTLPKWFRCVGFIGDISRYQWTHGFHNQNMGPDYWALNASLWYKLGIRLIPTNGKFYHHLAILATNDEMKKLYYFCRSLVVKTPFISARESAIPFFEANRQRFALIPNNGKQKTRRSYLHQRENLSPSRSTKGPEALENQDVQALFVRLHGMLFTKIGLDHFEDTLRVLIEKTCKGQNFQVNDKTDESRRLEFYLQMAVINLSSLYCYGSRDGSLITAIERQNQDLQKNSLAPDVDYAFSKGAIVTFELMKHFMTKYVIDARDNDNTEGWLLYCEVILLWMLASPTFDNFGNGSNPSIWEQLVGKKVSPNFWITLSQFMTRIARQVSPITKQEIIASDSALLPPPLAEDWELRGISWLRNLHHFNLFDDKMDLFDTSHDLDIERMLKSVAQKNVLNLDQDSKIRRRARVFELGIMLTKKIDGFQFCEEAFTSSLYLDIGTDSSVTEESFNPEIGLPLEDENKESKRFSWADEVEAAEDNWFDDPASGSIAELKERRLKLEALVAARSNGFRVKNPPRLSTSIHKVQPPPFIKKPVSMLSIISPGYTTLVIDTNCMVADLSMVKKIIQCEKWMVVVPMAVVTELDGLRLNPPPLGTAAREAITYLEQAMSRENRALKLKVQTGKGNYLTDICFNEEFDFGDGEDKKKNLDDIILGICIWHAENRQEKINQDGTGTQKEPVEFRISRTYNQFHGCEVLIGHNFLSFR
ncbi:hypothetical protein G9A89_023286 [Geosiphon pyriformis]|nr:hypothetical protein G9A89_023286 [Geosiphon pyriformis]